MKRNGEKNSPRARKIAPGDTFGVFAPGSPVEHERLAHGIEALEARGFKVKMPLDPSANYGKDTGIFASASVKERIGAFHELVNDKKVAAIIAARGGYGTLELLPEIDFEGVKKSGKLIVGYSDVTALLSAVTTVTGLPTIHGSVLTEFAASSTDRDTMSSIDSLLSLMEGRDREYQIRGEILRDGYGSGKILAGNLMILISLMGTPWEPSYDGKILVLEEVNEAPYRIHRALTQLKLAGKLARLAALVYGRFERCIAPNGPTVESVLKNSVNDILGGTNYPVLIGLPVGHGGENRPLPLGCRAEVKDGALKILESPVE